MSGSYRGLMPKVGAAMQLRSGTTIAFLVGKNLGLPEYPSAMFSDRGHFSVFISEVAGFIRCMRSSFLPRLPAKAYPAFQSHRIRRFAGCRLLSPIASALMVSWAIATAHSAEGPSLSTYQIIPGNSEKEGGELIMKVSNPPGRIVYIAGMLFNDPLIYDIEVERDGKWILAPGSPLCGTGARLRPLLADSYLIFPAYLPASVAEFPAFRVTMRVFYVPDFLEDVPKAGEKQYVEVVSEAYSSSDLRPIKRSSGRTGSKSPGAAAVGQ